MGYCSKLVVEPANAEIPITLASLIYLPAERWDEMNGMLDEATKRGPELVTPNGLTVANQVQNLREVAWSQQYQKGANLYNEVLQATDGEAPDEAQTASLLQAVEHFMTAVQINPSDERTRILQSGHAKGEVGDLRLWQDALVSDGRDWLAHQHRST